MRKNQIRRAIISRAKEKPLSDSELKTKLQEIQDALENETYDFTKCNKQVFTQGKKKRDIYCYEKLSVEDIICQCLKERLDKTFDIKYASRNQIMSVLFNLLPTVKDMNDFVIIRVDFKSFFDSVDAGHVFSKYILKSLMPREEKTLLKEYIEQNQYCYAGLSLSNALTEIICHEFDEIMKSKLQKYGAFLYERYVDDIIIILNSFISKESFLEIAKNTIMEVFGDDKLNFHDDSEKFAYIVRRDFKGTQEYVFSYLGYKFVLDTKDYSKNKKISFRYGISLKKIRRYSGIIDMAFAEYRKNGNLELLRHRIKILSTRVVISKSANSINNEWLTKGVVANYNELRYRVDKLDSETENFLKNVILEKAQKYNVTDLYFWPAANDENEDKETSIYNVFSNMKRNRTIVFDDRNGVSYSTLLRWIAQIDPAFPMARIDKKYYELVKIYLGKLKIKQG